MHKNAEFQCNIEYDLKAQRLKLFLAAYSPDFDTGAVWVCQGGSKWTKLLNGQEVEEPTLSLPANNKKGVPALLAIRDAINEFLGYSAKTSAEQVMSVHLVDAMETKDKLLELVESMVKDGMTLLSDKITGSEGDDHWEIAKPDIMDEDDPALGEKVNPAKPVQGGVHLVHPMSVVQKVLMPDSETICIRGVNDAGETVTTHIHYFNWTEHLVELLGTEEMLDNYHEVAGTYDG